MISSGRHPEDSIGSDLDYSRSGSLHLRSTWAHTPSNLTLIWLIISLPLVIWDTGYVVLRPYSMSGGSLHWPLWVPYALYAKTDYMYGWKAIKEHNGFTMAQSSLNIIETIVYIYYLYILYTYGRPSTAQGRGAPDPSLVGFLGQQRRVDGRMGALAVLAGYSAAVMTVAKTLLYGLNEYFSGFANIGHNSVISLLFLWILPNGAWIVLPTYIIYMMGSEMLQGLTIVAGGRGMSSILDTQVIKTD